MTNASPLPTGVPAAQPVTQRPTGLTIIIALWLINGVWTAFNSASDFLFLGPGSFLYNLISGLGVLFGVLYIVAALGFNDRKPWSYRLGLTLPTVGLAVLSVLYGYLWLGYGFDPADLVPFLPALFWFVVALVYLRQPHVKAFLLVV